MPHGIPLNGALPPDVELHGVTFEEALAEAVAVWQAEQSFAAEVDALAESRVGDFYPTGGHA